MRMWHYFLAGALLLAPALLATAVLGLAFDGSKRHLWAGLLTAILGVGVHTLVILFMLVTGRVLREAIRARRLSESFLAELNSFFSRKRAYPLAGLGAASIVAAGVLGYSSRGLGISPMWHWIVGIGAVALNLWALQEELRALKENQRLVDRASAELDEFDRAQAAAGIAPMSEPPAPPLLSLRNGLTLLAAPWLAYLYWSLVVWHGEFARVSLHPWVELSLLGALATTLALRKRASAP
ncbi:MAG: hypothetical protein FJ298_01880 [Planctomycetes bacterium]|nr:hypothetical protein [Planctomycetota bacterium]